MNPAANTEVDSLNGMMDRFPAQSVHGVFVSVSRAGVLILGESGTGKSECVLELVSRGHRLIADDVVEVRKIYEQVVGRAPDSLAGLLEVRGLGILDIRRLFGDSSVQVSSPIELCVEFIERRSPEQADRIRGETRMIDLLGVKIPIFTLPVDRRRNLGLLVETVVALFRCPQIVVNRDLRFTHDQAVSASPTASSDSNTPMIYAEEKA